MTDVPAVYMAGPIQHVNDYGRGWRNFVKKRYPDACEWLDPLDEYNSMEEAEAEWTDERIVKKDLDMIDRADALLVHWDTVPTCGTPMEIFYANVHDVPVIVQTTLPEYDLSPWLTHHSDYIVESFETALNCVYEATDNTTTIHL